MKISACVIVKNEESNIAKCITSYINVVDEVIVVDTGSEDKTVEIAQGLGAKVYYFEWINDFAKAKNYALSNATGDWIIFLDADEYFDVKKSENIPDIIRRYAKENTKIIGCKLINIDEKSGELIGTLVQARIFKRDKNIYYVSSIHERLHSDEKNVRAIYVPENELEIYHTGYSRDKISDKAERNLPMLLEDLQRKPVDPSLYYFLSDTYLTLKEYEQCVYYGQLFFKNRVNMIGFNSKVYQNVIVAMIKLKRNWKDIEIFIKQALVEFPEHPIFRMLLGEMFSSTKQYEKALINYKKAIEMNIKYKDIEINNLAGKTHEIEYAAALMLEYKNEEKEALDYYISALRRKKDYILALDKVLTICKKNNNLEFINILEKIYDNNNFEEMRFLVERLVNNRYKIALAYYVNLMLKKFNHQDFSIVIMFLTNEKYEQAFKHFYEAYTTNFQNDYAKLAIVAGYLNNSEEMLFKVRNVVKPSYKRIAEVMLSTNQESVLLQEDFMDYLDILMEIIKIGKEDYIDKFMNLKDKFKPNIDNISTAIGNVFKDNGNYEKAIEQYEKDLNINIENKLFVIGYCYYKMRNMEQALGYFKKALESGYMDNDMRVFLQWTKEQLSDEKDKELAHNLMRKFYNNV